MMLGSLWLIPWRMRFDPGGSYHTFGYIPDEIFYAQRLQPLIPGTTGANPLNGITDPAIVSQFFLEDACRTVISVTGIHVITFFWIFRIAFPLVFFCSMLLLSRSILVRRTKPWSYPLAFAMAVGCFSGIYFFYDVLAEPLPFRVWIDRIPTCIEYVLSVLLAWAGVRWCSRLDAPSGVLVAAIAAVLMYLRPYLAVPWLMALTVLGVWLLATRRLKWRPALLVVGFGILALTPWQVVGMMNDHSPTHREWIARYFDWDRTAYRVHSYVVMYEIFALLIALSALKIKTSWRPLVVSCAISLSLIPFVCGIIKPVGREMLLGDRFGSFYLVVMSCALMLLLRGTIDTWRGRDSWGQARRVVISASAAAACMAVFTGIRDMEFEFAIQPVGHYDSMVREQAFIPAYDWVREHTPAHALFVVDDGYDWINTPEDPAGLIRLLNRVCRRNDIFHLVARRRVLYTDWMVFSVISDQDLDELGTLQRGIFGCPVEMKKFLRALKRFRPGYVLWRKTPCEPVSHELAPIPRGLGVQLRKISDVVYSDSFCEIWKIHYSESELPTSAPAQ